MLQMIRKDHARLTTSSCAGGTLAPIMKSPVTTRLREVGALCCFLGAANLVNAQQQPATTPTAPAASTSAPTADEPRFDVWEYEVEGNTVLPVPAIEKAVQPYLGPGKQLADVEGARAALEKVYQDAGFLSVFVDLPEQQITEGLVHLRVLEGRVGRLAVVGARYYSQGYIRDHVPELQDGKVPNFNAVQSQLATVNRTEDRRVQPVLRPGRTPGTVEAELQVSDRLPMGGRVELYNSHAQYTKPWRLQATAHYDNLFQLEHVLSLTAIVAPQDVNQSKVFTASYTMPEANGDAWLVYGLASDSSVEPLGSTNVIGKGTTLGLRRIWSLPALSEYTHTFSAGADYKDQKEDTIAGSDRLATPVRYLPFNLAYNGGWQHADQSQTTFSATAVFGIRPWIKRSVDCAGYGTLDQFDCKRDSADGGFSTLRLDVRHTEPVFGRWAVQGRLAGQVATGPLISAEQYSIGGADTVRGYLDGESIGDHGALMSLELHSPNWAVLDAGAADDWRKSIDNLMGYAFFDAGHTVTINPAAGQAERGNLAGTGFGLKARALKHAEADLAVAWPLKSTQATPSGQPHVHVRMAVDF